MSPIEDLVIRMPLQHAPAALRVLVGSECLVAETETDLWLHLAYSAFDEADTAILQALPGRRYALGERGTLTKLGESLPTDAFPELKWSSISDFVSWELPAAAMAARPSSLPAKQLQLKRSARERPVAAILVTQSQLLEWIETAAPIRFQHLRYALKPSLPGQSELPGLVHQRQLDANQALVVGSPLPPILGQNFWQAGRVLLPVGFHWSPNLPLESVIEIFNLEADEWLVWQSDNQWSRLPVSCLDTLSRASVRELR